MIRAQCSSLQFVALSGQRWTLFSWEKADAGQNDGKTATSEPRQGGANVPMQSYE
jgi:hypothetical protein